MSCGRFEAMSVLLLEHRKNNIFNWTNATYRQYLLSIGVGGCKKDCESQHRRPQEVA